MRVLSLFSGIGLLDLGLAWAGMQTVGLCEIEPYCREVLAKHWPGVPIWSDVREVTGDAVRERCGAVDLVAGGAPCQPHSVAGKRKGREDERHLWPEMYRIVREVRPSWVLLENVVGLRITAADEVLSDLEASGYASWPLVVGACHVGAPQHRHRVFVVANAKRQGLEGQIGGRESKEARPEREIARREPLRPARGHWPPRPDSQRCIPLGFDGHSARLAGRDLRDAIKAIGNGVVPQVVAEVGRAIMAAELARVGGFGLIGGQ